MCKLEKVYLVHFLPDYSSFPRIPHSLDRSQCNNLNTQLLFRFLLLVTLFDFQETIYIDYLVLVTCVNHWEGGRDVIRLDKHSILVYGKSLSQ